MADAFSPQLKDQRANAFISIPVMLKELPEPVDRILSTVQSDEEYHFVLGELRRLQMDFSGAEAHFQAALHTGNIITRAYALRFSAPIFAAQGRLRDFNAAVQATMELNCNFDGGMLVKLAQVSLYSTHMVPQYTKTAIRTLFYHMDTTAVSEPQRMYVLFLYAMELFEEGKFQEFLLLSQTFFHVCPSPQYPILRGCFHIVGAVSHFFLDEQEEMKRSIQLACDILGPRNFMLPFVQVPAFVFEEMIDLVRSIWPECARMLDTSGRQCMNNRLKTHNAICKDQMSTQLTRREYETALLAAHGMSNKEIAAKLSISPYTVRTLLSNAFDRLEIESRKELRQFVYTFNGRDVS